MGANVSKKHILAAANTRGANASLKKISSDTVNIRRVPNCKAQVGRTPFATAAVMGIPHEIV